MMHRRGFLKAILAAAVATPALERIIAAAAPIPTPIKISPIPAAVLPEILAQPVIHYTASTALVSGAQNISFGQGVAILKCMRDMRGGKDTGEDYEDKNEPLARARVLSRPEYINFYK